MKPEKMDILLQKYYDGETTPEEEIIIRNEFSTNKDQNISEATAAYLKYTSVMGDIELKDDFDDKLFNKINNDSIAKRFKLGKLYYAALAVAASIILLIGVNLFNNKNITNTADDIAVEAQYEITKNALFLVSINLNKGFEQLENMEKINQSLDKLNKLNILNNFKYTDSELETVKGESL